ncbi:MAG: pseudouridine-5-phosphate glycosidase [SAR86 cluster bacterium]|uniref:Pseudouridine-5'-phosphate glycosidase n=1 Tax=SAR86 cluster bacterium TaxID=2030880 RepID=A0A2A4X8B7_9GAMM|nr:pseudouridine-5'-phosphate glycosidase [Sneathiella sp.]PCI78800.1 MAG: pseudouridine-5-phosphate glycosidase [SAR86 cluster bacterium]
MEIDYSPAVKQALEAGVPVVALESTIISHGFPYPKNIELAAKMEEIILAEGAVPATIAIIKGRIKCGLTEDELELLATSDDVLKCSVRDLPVAVGGGKTGATTVASTSYIAELAGIRVFATGGIGGVHRAEEGGGGFDVSADLLELSRSNVVVVAAGAKSILDLPATLEVLESYSVPVIGYKTDTFPAFHSISSGLPVPASVSNMEELSQIACMHFKLGLPSGMLVCNPIPAEYAMDNAEVDALVEKARQAAVDAGAKGAAITPYILGALNRLSNGKTSEVNMALALNNGKIAAQLAVHLLSQLEKD